MSAPTHGIHPLAVVGQPPEHRDHRSQVGYTDYPFPTLARRVAIDPSALLEAFVTVDAGVREPTRIGARSWAMKRVHIGHDAQVGADCELAPGTVIGGHAVLEDGVRCGIGVLVLPFKRVGAGARLGAGAVVTKDVPAGEVWVGNPARRLGDAWDETEAWQEWYDASRKLHDEYAEAFA